MRILDRYLLTLLGLLVLTGLAITLPRGEIEPRRAPPIHELPRRLDGWFAAEGVAEEILPRDPRAIETIRRTYAKEGQMVYLAIGRYRPWKDAHGRPAFDLIVPESGAIAIERHLTRVPLEGIPQPGIPVQLLSVRRPERHISVVYWYHLGEDTIAGEYRFRLAQLLNTLLFRPQEVLLVRLAMTGPEWPEEFLRRLYPDLVGMLAEFE